MKWFKKKKEQPATKFEIPEIPHQHTWKDMPWYMGIHYNGVHQTAGYKIVEPYICITCGERKNITLEEEDYSGISPSERERMFQDVRNKYKDYLKPRAIVEDMINNILLVKDPGYLAMLEEMKGLPHKNVGSSAKMEIEQKKEPEFRIILPSRRG